MCVGVQTHVMPKTCDPDWNCERVLSFQSDKAVVYFRVFDRDAFSTDDALGEAEIALSALANREPRKIKLRLRHATSGELFVEVEKRLAE